MNPKQALRESVEAWVSKIWCLDLRNTGMCNFFNGSVAADVALLKISKDILIQQGW